MGPRNNIAALAERQNVHSVRRRRWSQASAGLAWPRGEGREAPYCDDIFSGYEAITPLFWNVAAPEFAECMLPTCFDDFKQAALRMRSTYLIAGAVVLALLIAGVLFGTDFFTKNPFVSDEAAFLTQANDTPQNGGFRRPLQRARRQEMAPGRRP